ncbi:PREDICTED: uncharacterized protein LOC104800177 isoform X2 [Tarenaya hassleriana]|uniref:uncharacterized protein LOC104800177 isoform X2 n=1 Tax=Tarenaya hassleriana TaxID=28532 RepID=UPI00053C8825|nr:PREDICTED: uncharacterized protein LOC104800177 isoform X2 [Tarenaya hassleriana]
MVKENPREMQGVIITVYVDRETTAVRSSRPIPANKNKIVRRRLTDETGKTRGSDRKARLLAYARELRAAANLAGDSYGSPRAEKEKKKKRKKRKWIRRVVARFRLPFLRLFRRKNPTWRYRRFVPDGEEESVPPRKSKACDSEFWKKLKHTLGGISRCGCNKRSFV